MQAPSISHPIPVIPSFALAICPMDGFTLGQLSKSVLIQVSKIFLTNSIDHREDCAAPDTAATFDGSVSSSDGNPSLMPSDDDTQLWLSHLLAAPPLEPAMPPRPGAFAPFDYAPSFDPQPLCLDAPLAFPPTNSLMFPGSLNINNAPYSSLYSQSGSNAAPTSPTSTDASLSFALAPSLLPASWSVADSNCHHDP